MRKILLVLLFLLAACGDGRDSFVRAETSPAQSGIGQVDPNRGPCPSGYKRSGPGVCVRGSGSAPPAVVVATTCTPIDLASNFAVSSTSKAVWLILHHHLVSGTAAGAETVQSFMYSDSGCTVEASSTLYSWGGILTSYSGFTSAGTIFSRVRMPVLVNLDNGTTIYMKKVEFLLAGGSTDVEVLYVGAIYD